MPRDCHQSFECGSSYGLHHIGGFFLSFKIVIVPTFLLNSSRQGCSLWVQRQDFETDSKSKIRLVS
ncbi:hypothetical protein C4Q31_12710 [Leptospira borgpetersenii serovar Ceylonica]|nr:hypothetical protein C4Q31_12710 [Leptospira borgpetersenii serovar Ceylonica]